MTIGPEQDRRREPRVPVYEGWMSFELGQLRLIDWSASGFLAEGKIDGLNPGATFSFSITARVPRANVEAVGTATVLRVADGRVAGTWDLARPSQDALEALRLMLR